ncbi:MAG: hypothetical protein ACOYL6_07540 [Bacteriovoracaceae bacterium]
MARLKRQKDFSLGREDNYLLHDHAVDVRMSHLDEIFTMEFTVLKKKPNFWIGSQTFLTESENAKKNWGLWNYDVVEAFLQVRNTVDEVRAPYVEVQVSPLNQSFNLIITEPRKIYYTPLELKFAHQVKLFETEAAYGFQANLSLELPWRGKFYFGNFFACLGYGENREYFALNPNHESAPDFHRPELFASLPENLT